jgi:hypothetical protein
MTTDKFDDLDEVIARLEAQIEQLVSLVDELRTRGQAERLEVA